MRRRLMCLGLAAFALLSVAATTVAAPPAPPPTVTAVDLPDVRGYVNPGFAAVSVNPAVTAKWDVLLESGGAWSMCLAGAVVKDTLRVAEDPVSTCTTGSARYVARPSCEPLEIDSLVFVKSNERFRFVVCAPGRSFLLIRPIALRPVTVPTSRGT